MKRKILSVLIVIVLAMAIPVGVMADAQGSTSFTDISGNMYESAIDNLLTHGIVSGDGNGMFRPDDMLRKNEAAVILQNTFKLVDVQYRTSTDAELEKIMISTEMPISSIEAAILPAANDVEGWAKPAVETVVEARLLSVNNGNFVPNDYMSSREFATAVGKAVFGAENDIDVIAALRENGLIPEDAVTDDNTITRGAAAYMLSGIVGNDNFKIIPTMITSDIHGRVLPTAVGANGMSYGGMSRVATMVDMLKEIDEDALILDGGDSPYNTNMANLFMGKSMVDTMNAAGFDATVLGNHDFDYEFENLLELAERADYDMLSANTYWASGEYPEQFKPYIVEEIDGIKVSIVGLTEDESKLYTHYTNTKDIMFEDHLVSGKETVAMADAESDVVIVLSHIHGDNMLLPVEVPEIDLEVGGGNDIFGRPEYVGDTVVVNPGGYTAVVTQVNINVLNKEMIGYTANQLIVSEIVPEDAEVAAIIADYQGQMDNLLDEVIGQAADEFTWSTTEVRSSESAIANLTTDALKEYFEADIAIQNGGGVRGGFTTGDITLENIYGALPFDNRVVLIETTGEQIVAALENGVSQYPATAGKFLHAAGLSYRFDGAKPEGERIVSVTMDDGTEIDLDKTYSVVINDFMGGGGDGFTMFNVLNADSGITDKSTLITETNDYIRDVLADYIREKGTITPEVEGRIIIDNPQEGDSMLG